MNRRSLKANQQQLPYNITSSQDTLFIILKYIISIFTKHALIYLFAYAIQKQSFRPDECLHFWCSNKSNYIPLNDTPFAN